jgi:glucoamylase
VQRYQVEAAGSPFGTWRFNLKSRRLAPGQVLRVELMAPATVHWSADGWQTTQDTPAEDTSLGVYVADLPTSELAAGTRVVFTFYWAEAARWEGTDYVVVVGGE